MPITELAVRQLEPDFPGITIVARRTRFLRTLMDRLKITSGSPDPTDVAAVSVVVNGIRGGHHEGRVDYHLIVDVSRLQLGLPKIWVTEPADADIRHVNIWRDSHSDGFCSWLGVSLPHLCWFSFEAAWASAPAQSRTLGAALEYAKQLLNTENHDSPAR